MNVSGSRWIGLMKGLRTRQRRFWCVGVVVSFAFFMVCVGSALGDPSEQEFEIVPGSFHLTPSSLQAGAHADWTLNFDFAHDVAGKTFNDVRSTVVEYPTGFMGNANRFQFPTCTLTQLLAQGPPIGIGTLCPAASQVGIINFEVSVKAKAELWTAPLYNMETTSFGVTAELGFKTAILTQTLPVMVRPADSGITGLSKDIEEIGDPHNISVTVWGVPGAHVHDPERGKVCSELGLEEVVECVGGDVETKVPAVPFLANPTSCEHSLVSRMKADAWEEQQPSDWFETPVEVGPRGAVTEVGPFVECERVHFNPAMTIKPTTGATESPSGVTVSLEVPQTWENPDTIATSNVRDVTVTLPPGYTVNPSEGNGLLGCSPQQYAAETAFSASSQGCPPQSRIGTVSIETPVLGERIEGSVYLAQPYDNPFSEPPEHPNGSLLALYVVAKAPDRGIIVKTAGRVEPDPVTGQLTSTFEGLPQQPFSRVTFKLVQGTTSPLVSPQLCGNYTAQAKLTPSSAPNDPHTVSNSLEIEKGVAGGACPQGGAPPFNPAVIAGTENNVAGGYSPFYLRIDRKDGEQELTRFSTILPPGLTGNLTGIPFCLDTQIEAARHATGLQELQAPSCPTASEIGHTLVGAGVGSILAWTPGKVYLAGPYNGAPFSIVSVTSATVGPFDLGTVVIRFALRINPTTAQPEVDASGSEPIPHIIHGIVAHVREVHVYMDRSHFILNPTNCARMAILDTVTGAGADFANPADQVPVTVSTPFQEADCANLVFKPKFTAATAAKTNRRQGASLSVTLTYPKAPQGTQANIRSVKVNLPKQLPSRLSTLQKACPDKTFNVDPAACPASSRVGHATAITPILPVPLIGPAYFVSHGGAKFPELIIVLQGYGVTIELHGETFINEKTNVTSSTFRTVPDQPVTSFQLTLPQGPNSALAATANLCKVKLKMPTAFTAQNGLTLHQSTKISVHGCPKAKAKHRAKTKNGH